MRRVVLCVCLLSLFVGNTAYAHSPRGLTIQSYPLPAQVLPYYPIFRGNQLWFSPLVPGGTLMYLINGKTTTVQLPSTFPVDGGALLASDSKGGIWASGIDTGSNFVHFTAKNQINVNILDLESATSSVGGADGSLWYTGDGSSISKISPSGIVTHFQVRSPYPFATAQIVRASDGSFWSSNGNDITHITPQGKMSTFTPSFYGSPQQLIALPDGRIWILVVDTNSTDTNPHIAIMDGKGKMQSYTFDEPANVMDPNNISYEHWYAKNFVTVLAHDGTLWFLDYRHRQLVHSTIYGHIIKLYSFPGLVGGSVQGMLTMGPDGALWLTEQGQFVRITLA